MRTAFSVVALLAACFLHTSANAVSLPIVNFSFEDPVVPPRSDTGITPGWVRSDLTNGASGIYRPPGGEFSQIPEGVQVAYIQTGNISQTLANILEPNAEYTLSVSVGERSAEPLLPNQYAVQLLAGGNVIAETTGPDPGPNKFVETVISYSPAINDPLLGQALEIRLVDLNPSIFESDPFFDNVRLDVVRIPEPCGLSLGLISALLGLAARRRG